MKLILAALILPLAIVRIAAACPEGYHEESRVDPCGRRENHPTCVQWDEDHNCTAWRDEWVCVPTSRTTCEPD